MFILIADGDASIRKELGELFKEDHEVFLCENLTAATGVLERETVDLVLSAITLPDGSGTDFLSKAKTISPKSECLLYAVPGSVRAIRNALVAAKPTRTVPTLVGTAASAEADFSRGLTDRIDELESRIVLQAMATTNHNQVRAARLLKITRGALQYKLKKYNYVKPGETKTPPPEKKAA